MALNDKQAALCEQSKWDFSDLSAVFLNCTLKKSPEVSHTEGLIRISREIMEKNGIKTETIRPVDHRIAFGVYPDMTEHGWDVDEWPPIYEKVKAANIVVIGASIWLGEGGSAVRKRSVSRTAPSGIDRAEASGVRAQVDDRDLSCGSCIHQLMDHCRPRVVPTRTRS